MAELLTHGGGPPAARCVTCGAEAVGPCARCHRPLCGDCCVLKSGSTGVWAVCFACDRGGISLARGWLTVIGWVLGPIAALALALVFLYLLFGNPADR